MNVTGKVQRATALRGQAVAPRQKSRQLIRKSTERELALRDSDIPYRSWEKANRDLVCSLIERQDRATESLLLLINDLQYRMDDIEYNERVPPGSQTGSAKEDL